MITAYGIKKIMLDIIADSEFATGGIPTVEKSLIQQTGLTERQISRIEYRLYAIFKTLGKAING